ncbi:MAG TPA: hypothetical protein VMR52_07130 [Dehalococcoidia bacterium]|nr:hypothetical protein [Dehalococcoidia bacterium]
MRIPLLIPAAAAVCLLAACSRSTSDSTPPPTFDFVAEAQRVVPSAVLTVEDLTGFEPQDVGALKEQAALSAECNVFDAATVFADAAATAESDPFLGPGDQQIFNHAAIYKTAEEASAGIADTQAVLDRCEDEFKEVVERIARDELERLGIELGLFSSIDVTIAYIDPPAAGDEILGYRMNVTVDLVIARQEYNLDVAFLRVGRVAGAVMLGTFGSINLSNQVSLLDRAEARLAGAEEALPE